MEFEHGFHLLLFPTFALLGENRVENRPSGVGLRVAVGFHLRNELRSWEWSKRIELNFIVPDIQGYYQQIPRSICEGYQINAKSVIYGRIQDWLGQCQNLHFKTCRLKDIYMPMQLKCINCVIREIFSFEQGNKYFCFSYVCKYTRISRDSLP